MASRKSSDQNPVVREFLKNLDKEEREIISYTPPRDPRREPTGDAREEDEMPMDIVVFDEEEPDTEKILWEPSAARAAKK